ncbi:MAG: hypothetical protein ACYTF1_14350 [Planctomycetota bacterium]
MNRKFNKNMKPPIYSGPLLSVIILLMLLAILPVMAQVGGNYDLSWNTIDGGGEMFSVGGTYSLGGTIAQYDASVLAHAGGNYVINGGFWEGAAGGGKVKPDFDKDGDVDQYDFDAFQACASGPMIPRPAGCEEKDFDTDNDVDQDDFGIFQRCYSGENNPADPNCAN